MVDKTRRIIVKSFGVKRAVKATRPVENNKNYVGLNEGYFDRNVFYLYQARVIVASPYHAASLSPLASVLS
jgi:hypothetical protein